MFISPVNPLQEGEGLAAGVAAVISSLWEEGVRVHSGTAPPGPPVIEPCSDDPFPNDDTEPVLEQSGVPGPPETISYQSISPGCRLVSLRRASSTSSAV
jgi:hypothetical protein